MAVALLDMVTCPYVDTQIGSRITAGWVLQDLFAEALGGFTFILSILINTDSETTYCGTNKFFVYAVIAISLAFSRGFAPRTAAINPAVALMTELM
jgi:aquaporin PIP